MTDAPRETVALRKTDARLAERSGAPLRAPKRGELPKTPLRRSTRMPGGRRSLRLH